MKENPILGARVTTSVRPVGEGVSVIDIQGEVNGQAEASLMDAYSRASSGEARAVLLNFSGLDYMNSSGVGLLVTMLVRAQRQGIKLMAYGLDEHYQAIFELTRLNEAIQIFSGEAQARQAASGAPA